PPPCSPPRSPAGTADATAVQGTSAATPLALPRINNLRRRVPRSETRLEEDVLAVILTSGDGTPLEALTHWRCMAALPFAGLYRSIDFALSNCTNSGIRRVGVATQYKAHSLIQHLRDGWSRLWPGSGESIELWPAQRCRNHDCYRGTADTAYQNIHVIREHAPTELLVLAGNHLCRMNYARLIDEHRRRAADVTLAYMELPLADAGQYGILSTDTDHWVRTFAEKPPAAANGHGTAERVLVSLGVYVFDPNSLIDLLRPAAGEVQRPRRGPGVDRVRGLRDLRGGTALGALGGLRGRRPHGHRGLRHPDERADRPGLPHQARDRRCRVRDSRRNRDRRRISADAAEPRVAERHRAVCPAARRRVRRLRPPAGTLAPEPAGAARNLPDAVAPSLE